MSRMSRLIATALDDNGAEGKAARARLKAMRAAGETLVGEVHDWIGDGRGGEVIDLDADLDSDLQEGDVDVVATVRGLLDEDIGDDVGFVFVDLEDASTFFVAKIPPTATREDLQDLYRALRDHHEGADR